MRLRPFPAEEVGSQARAGCNLGQAYDISPSQVYEGLKVAGANRKQAVLRAFVGVGMLAASVGLGIGASSAQQLAARTDHQQQQNVAAKPAMKPGVTTVAAASTAPVSTSDVKPVRRSGSKGAYYVDFRARTAASYG